MAGHTTFLPKKKIAYGLLVGKPEGKTPNLKTLSYVGR
jgi:hypothetical protein